MLKQSSKPVPQQRKRRKIELMGTFEQFMEAQEAQVQDQSEPGSRLSQGLPSADQAEHGREVPSNSGFGVPNVIGNAGEVEEVKDPESYPVYPLADHGSEDCQQVPGDLSNFKDVTMMPTRSKRKK